MPLDLGEDVWAQLTYGPTGEVTADQAAKAAVERGDEVEARIELIRRVEAIRKGLGLLVPHRLLLLFTPHELEFAICGEPLDISKLEATCQYESCRASDELIQNLWTVVKDELSDAER
jgi:hypothetical protein